MRKSTSVTGFIMELAFLVDKGIVYSIDEVNRHIEQKDVLNWLERQHPFGSDYGLDLSMYDQNDRAYIHEELESMWLGYGGKEKRKWGITQNGLCILICWLTEIVRNLYPRD